MVDQNIFNGGKMYHLFEKEGRNYKDEYYRPDSLYHIFPDEKKEALTAASFGNVFLKVDGSCGHIEVDENGEITCYQRYQDKKGVVNISEIHDSKIIACCPFQNLYEGKNATSNKGKKYYMRRILLNTLKKKERIIWDQVYGIAKMAAQNGDLLPNNHYSVEYVGAKFNSTPCIIEDVGIAIHHLQNLESLMKQLDPPTSRAEWPLTVLKYFERFFLHFAIEGLVIEYKGRWWKVRADGFKSCRESSRSGCALEKLWKSKKSTTLKKQWKEHGKLHNFTVIRPHLL